METKAPPSMHHARCLGWTYGDTKEGGETAHKAVLLLCVSIAQVSEASHDTIPNAAAVTVAHRSPRG